MRQGHNPCHGNEIRMRAHKILPTLRDIWMYIVNVITTVDEDVDLVF